VTGFSVPHERILAREMGHHRSPASLLASVLALAVLAACDEEKKPAPTPAAPTASAPAAPSSPPLSPSAAAPPAKKVVECSAGNEVTFADTALEAEVRRKLGKDAGALTKADLKQVKSINLTSAPVNELDPCVFPLLTNVKDVYLGQGELEDLSPLASLTSMLTLRASINKVSDVHPLAKLTQMDRLDLGRTLVSDITPIGNMAGLTELQLDDTQVSDLAPLRACTKLEKLSIKRTPVKDLSPLREMKKLRFLYVEGSAVTSTTVLDPLLAGGLRIVRTANR
jgi:internalin A